MHDYHELRWYHVKASLDDAFFIYLGGKKHEFMDKALRGLLNLSTLFPGFGELFCKKKNGYRWRDGTN